MKPKKIYIIPIFILLIITCKNHTHSPEKIEIDITPQVESNYQISGFLTDTTFLNKKNIKPVAKEVYYEFYKQILKNDIIILNNGIQNTEVDSIILSDLISIVEKGKINGNRYNFYFKIYDSIKKENLRDKIEYQVELTLNDLKLIYYQSNKKPFENLDFNKIGINTISQSDFDKIIKEFDINGLSTKSKSEKDGPFCIIHLPIFSTNNEFAIMKYEYIPFPREYSSGTFLFKKINGTWRSIGNLGVITIS